MPEIVNSVHQVEWNEALEEFKEACHMFYEDTRGRLSEFSDEELKERVDRYDEAREELYELINRQCQVGEGIEIVLDGEEDRTVEIAEPTWYHNGSMFAGFDREERHGAADLMKAEKIRNL